MSQHLQTLRDHLRDPLYRNGYALMLNTAITGGLGMIYWVLAARVYDSSEVGRNSALIAAMTLISALTQMNLAAVLIRFLARAGQSTAKLILATYAISITFAAVAATVVLLIVGLVADETNALNVSWELGAWFVIATATWSIFCLQDAALTGLRRSTWVPVKNGIFGIAKIPLLFAFVPLFASAGIFASYTVPVVLSLLPFHYLIFKRFLGAHVKDTESIAQPLDIKQIRSFVAGDYLSSLFGQAMTTLIPVLVVAVLDADANAYFYIAQTIGLTLDLIAWNLANSMTAEAAGREHQTAELAKSVLRRTAGIVLPLALLTFLLAPYLLAIFGDEYRQEGTWLLRLLVLSSIPRIVMVVYAAVARLEHKTHRNAILSSVQATLMIGGSIILMQKVGLVGVGYAAILSQTLVAGMSLPWLLKSLRQPSAH